MTTHRSGAKHIGDATGATTRSVGMGKSSRTVQRWPSSGPMFQVCRPASVVGHGSWQQSRQQWGTRLQLDGCSRSCRGTGKGAAPPWSSRITTWCVDEL